KVAGIDGINGVINVVGANLLEIAIDRHGSLGRGHHIDTRAKQLECEPRDEALFFLKAVRDQRGNAGWLSHRFTPLACIDAHSTRGYAEDHGIAGAHVAVSAHGRRRAIFPCLRVQRWHKGATRCIPWVFNVPESWPRATLVSPASINASGCAC